MEAKDPLQEVKGEAAQPVPVGNHNFWHHSFGRELQNGTEAFSLEINSGCNIGDDAVVWELLLHEVNLSPEVVFLVRGRDAAITDSLFCRSNVVSWMFPNICRFIPVFCPCGGSNDTWDPKEALASWGSDGRTESIVSPFAESDFWDVKDFFGFPEGDEGSECWSCNDCLLVYILSCKWIVITDIYIVYIL